MNKPHSSPFNKKTERRHVKQRPMTTYHIERNFAHILNPNSVGIDGVHHINLATYGQTELGRSLAERREISLFHPVYGFFSTLERFKTWLSLEGHSDSIRTMDTETYKVIVRSPHAIQKDNVPNYYALLMSALWYKVKNHAWLLEAVRQNDLPFHCYSEHQKTGYRSQRDEWIYIIIAMDVITKALKEDRDPDFTPFMTHPDIPLEESVFGKLVSSRDSNHDIEEVDQEDASQDTLNVPDSESQEEGAVEEEYAE